MEFTVQFNNANIETIKIIFMEKVKEYAEYARQSRINECEELADHYYRRACRYVWCSSDFGLISLDTALELIYQIAEHIYKD